jgi:hypothetical protein
MGYERAHNFHHPAVKKFLFWPVKSPIGDLAESRSRLPSRLTTVSRQSMPASACGSDSPADDDAGARNCGPGSTLLYATERGADSSAVLVRAPPQAAEAEREQQKLSYSYLKEPAGRSEENAEG